MCIVCIPTDDWIDNCFQSIVWISRRPDSLLQVSSSFAARWVWKNIQSCKSLPIVNFTAVNVELPEVDSQSLSSDQQYLLDICNAVARGHCLPSLALMNPGKLCHERWLTTANRILQLYVASSEPSDNLRLIVEFIIKVYCIMWFTIRSKPSCSERTRHLWQTIKSTRYSNDALKAIVDPVISRNAYYAHPENLLLAMISDDRLHIRTLGLRRIMKARSMTPSENETTIRTIPSAWIKL